VLDDLDWAAADLERASSLMERAADGVDQPDVAQWRFQVALTPLAVSDSGRYEPWPDRAWTLGGLTDSG
jgi:hypothetical protein